MPDYGLVCKKLKANFPEFNLDIDFSIERGKLASIIGPSGCGKSTTLNLISGLLSPKSGNIIVNGKDVTNTKTNKRKIALVFQDYALFPHMTVSQNIAYPLKIQKYNKKEIQERIKKYLSIVNLIGYGKRNTSSLSGGERQRVALARALASNPDVLLLDEPLSALDVKLRDHLRLEIRRIQKQTGITTLYVTHDQEEAFSISDKVIVMNNGRVEMADTPEEVYTKPSSLFTASFTGGGNILPYSIVPQTVSTQDMIFQNFGDEHRIFFRPEQVTVNEDRNLPFPEFLPSLIFNDAKIDNIQYKGREYVITCSWKGYNITAISSFKPKSNIITIGIRLDKVLEYNSGRILKL